jgi:hypothetical protein
MMEYIMTASQITRDDINADDVPLEVVDYVRAAFRFAVGITLMYGAFCCLTLLLWTWLAAVLALIVAVIGEKVVLKLADKHIDAAAQVTADALVCGYSWLRAKYAAATAK